MAKVYTVNMERAFSFRTGDEVKPGKITVGEIRWLPERKEWACDWSIEPINPEVGRIYGKDPLDALIKTLDFLSTLIRGSEIDGLECWWAQPGDHAGFVFRLSESRAWEKNA
jgi:hypothetical protein